MSFSFNADEILKMAEQIERNGARFYRSAADAGFNQGISDKLIELAEMEDSHEKTFAAMRGELAGADRRSLTADPDDEGALYLKAAAEGKVFAGDPSEALSGRESMAEILNAAIDLEKDSIVFYQGMKAVVPAEAGKGRLDAIIKQEIGHILDLTGQLEALDT